MNRKNDPHYVQTASLEVSSRSSNIFVKKSFFASDFISEEFGKKIKTLQREKILSETVFSTSV